MVFEGVVFNRVEQFPIIFLTSSLSQPSSLEQNSLSSHKDSADALKTQMHSGHRSQVTVLLLVIRSHDWPGHLTEHGRMIHGDKT